MLKRILFVFVPILLLLLVSCSEKKTKEQLLIRKWKIEVLKDEGRITPTNKVDFIAFTHDHKFIINTKDAKLKHTGQWYLVGDSLTLSFTPPPNNVAADSSVVNIKGDENSVTLYNNHEVIGSIDNGAVHPFQKKSTFHISKLDKEKLAFATTNQEWNLIYREEKLIGTGFSWGGFMNGFIGILGLTLIGVMLSAHRRRINWALIIKAVLLQFLFAFCILKIPAFGYVFGSIAGFFVTILEFTRAGSTFLFGGLVSNVNSYGFIFVFQVLPTIIFVAAFTSALFYLNVLQRIVFGFAWVMKRVMGLSGAESLASAANIFVGQTEAPLVIKPYIPSMTRSETMALMTGGMAHISGGVLAAYIGFLGGADPEQQRLFATHLLSASIMTAPGTFFAAKLMMPETEEFNKDMNIPKEKIGSNILDAIANGTTEGLRLAANVAAMLLVFIAFMAMINYVMQNWIGDWTGLNEVIRASSHGAYSGLTLQYILGYVFAPLAWLIGIRDADVFTVGQLLGQKTIINEFVAYTSFAELKDHAAFLNPKSIIITTYALCGFANFSSIGIQIGGIGTLAPSKRPMLASLGLRALIGGTIANLMSAAIAGMML